MELSPEQARRIDNVRANHVLRICKHLLDAYELGELKFEQFSRCVYSVISKFNFSGFDITISADHFGDKGINKTFHIENNALAHRLLLGLQIAEALSLTPPKRKRGNPGQPEFVRKFSIDLVKNTLKGSGMNLSRTGKKVPWGTIPTAYEWVAEYWKDVGIRGVTPAAVEKWCLPKHRNTTKKINRRVTR